jgi:hypothetical protein
VHGACSFFLKIFSSDASNVARHHCRRLSNNQWSFTMATRSRTTQKSSKTAAPPPVAGSVLEEEQRATSARGEKTGTSNADTTYAATVQVTNATLERHEIPSFSESREARIAEAAYWRAEQRGFTPGRELDDWLEAEREIDAGVTEKRRSG